MNQYSSMDGLAWSFTANGALATDSILSHEFDAEGRLVRSTENLTGTVVLENVHAPDGRRVLTRRGGETLRFLHDGWQVFEERAVDEASGVETLLRQHVTGRWMDDHVQLLDAASGEVYYHHANDQGFTGALTDSSGWPVEFYEYSWLGRPSVLDPLVPGSVTGRSSVGNPYLFQGRRWEPEVQLYDFRHRWYSPGSGEFLSLDPTGTWRHGMGNGYEAFLGNPWDFGDPMGELPPGVKLGTAPLVGAELVDDPAMRVGLRTAAVGGFLVEELFSEVGLLSFEYLASELSLGGLDGYQALTGDDPIRGEKLEGWERGAALASLLPVCDADVLRRAKRALAWVLEKIKAALALGRAARGTARKAPDFVVSPGGTAYPVPPGASRPVPVVNPGGARTGTAFTGGSGGANGQVDTIRLMDPTPPRGASPGYPNGYVTYENAAGQAVDPYTGSTVPRTEAHFPLDPEP